MQSVISDLRGMASHHALMTPEEISLTCSRLADQMQHLIGPMASSADAKPPSPPQQQQQRPETLKRKRESDEGDDEEPVALNRSYRKGDRVRMHFVRGWHAAVVVKVNPKRYAVVTCKNSVSPTSRLLQYDCKSSGLSRPTAENEAKEGTLWQAFEPRVKEFVRAQKRQRRDSTGSRKNANQLAGEAFAAFGVCC